MYYKIVNKDSSIYQKLVEQREKELKTKEENKVLLKQHIPYAYEKFAGFTDQGARRIPIPVGFYFLHPEEVDLTVWKEDGKRKGLFYPSKRTKAGREMEKFLESLKSYSAFRLLDEIGIDYCGEFHTPFLEMAGDVVVLHLDDHHEPKDENFIEITKKEACELFELTK
ncbi:hypothetical protein [Bacteroides sp.]|uniref:hypothetical protein n=1 Tax=Bacteroides sp. TaxID=29523 RepID=UPI00262476A3|nr:hypothetical protein [Bacteroides sp.]MDD3037924.1 hypothetical protein [Bacteroides sp.]